jgi:subtilisin family serine protease
MEAGQILTGGAAYGKNTVDFGAPGRRLPTTSHDLSIPYVFASGTSVATAETSGCVAILKHAFPNENYRALIGRLYSGIEPAIEGDLLTNTICTGYLNLFKAIQYQQVTLAISFDVSGQYITINHLVPGREYTLQGSDDLLTWSDLSHFTATASLLTVPLTIAGSEFYARVRCP